MMYSRAADRLQLLTPDTWNPGISQHVARKSNPRTTWNYRADL